MSTLASDPVLPPAFDGRRFRDVLGHYPSGITVVTGEDDEGLVGFTCQSFFSVSIDPPLVSLSIMRTSESFPRLRQSGRFAVNVLGESQLDVSQRFARKGEDRWAGVAWERTENGTPVLCSSVAWVDCELWAEYDAGDHVIVIGLVHGLGEPEPASPLLFHRGQYRGLTPLNPVDASTEHKGNGQGGRPAEGGLG